MQGLRETKVEDISAKPSKLKGLLEEEDRKRLFLVTVMGHSLLSGILILKLFQGSTTLFQKTKQKSFPKKPDLNGFC